MKLSVEFKHPQKYNSEMGDAYPDGTPGYTYTFHGAEGSLWLPYIDEWYIADKRNAEHLVVNLVDELMSLTHVQYLFEPVPGSKIKTIPDDSMEGQCEVIFDVNNIKVLGGIPVNRIKSNRVIKRAILENSVIYQYHDAGLYGGLVITAAHIDNGWNMTFSKATGRNVRNNKPRCPEGCQKHVILESLKCLN